MLDFSGFNIAALPRIVFGKGVFSQAPELVAAHGRCVLIVTGDHSFRATPRWRWLTKKFKQNNVVTFDMKVIHEPTPQLVDEAVAAFSANKIEVVLGA